MSQFKVNVIAPLFCTGVVHILLIICPKLCLSTFDFLENGDLYDLKMTDQESNHDSSGEDVVSDAADMSLSMNGCLCSNP